MTPAPFNSFPGDPIPRADCFWLRAEDGLRLRAGLWRADRATGTVLLFAGRTEYLEKYNQVADELNAAGFDVLAIDWRGQGLSDRLLPDPRPGHIADFADYQRDVVEMVIAAQELDLPRPRHMLAHSMGGTIGYAALLGGLPVQSAVLSAPMFGIDLRKLPEGLALALANLLIRLGRGDLPAPGAGGNDNFVLSAPYLDNLLTGDGARWGRAVAENATWPEVGIGGATSAWIRAALLECRRLAALPSPEVPALIALGTQERVVSAPAIRARLANWPGTRLLELPDCHHEPMMERDAIRDAFMQAAIAHFRGHGR